ncbi:MAG: transcriptional regulator [Gammaproteobacteria bacterium]
MKPHFALFAALAATTVMALASGALEPLPSPWTLAGESPGQYVAGIDRAASSSKAGAKYIAGADEAGKSWATLMRMAPADDYRGRRVQFQARVKTRDVNWAGLWLRVDGGGRMLAFYNSQDRPIKGTTDWQLRNVTLDVPSNADTLAFGVINDGGGEVWIDEVKLATVDPNVPLDRFKPPVPTDPVE